MPHATFVARGILLSRTGSLSKLNAPIAIVEINARSRGSQSTIVTAQRLGNAKLNDEDAT
jgi:hypothetical protein